MLTLVICLVVLLATPIYADNVELTSTKTRRFTCPGDMVTFTCEVFGSSSLEWRSLLITQTALYTAISRPPDILNRGPFTASLTSVSGTPLNANFTSTLQVNASRMFMRDATTVMCLSSTPESETANFTTTEIPAAPQNVTLSQVERASGGSVSVWVSWMQPQNYEQFDIDRYDINVTSTSGVQYMTTADGRSIRAMISVSENPNNVQMNTTFTATIAAVNLCGENGPTGTASCTFSLPSPPRTPSSTVQQYGRDSVTLTVQWQPPQYDGGAPVSYIITVSPDVGTFTTGGTSIMVAAVPYNVMHTVSIVSIYCHGNSSAAIGTFTKANCSDPTLPMDGSIDPYHNTTEGAEIFFRCDLGFVPAGRMRAVCGADGRWNPDPATLNCTSSSILTTDQIIGIAAGGGGGVILILIALVIITIAIVKKKKNGKTSAATSTEMEEMKKR